MPYALVLLAGSSASRLRVTVFTAVTALTAFALLIIFQRGGWVAGIVVLIYVAIAAASLLARDAVGVGPRGACRGAPCLRWPRSWCWWRPGSRVAGEGQSDRLHVRPVGLSRAPANHRERRPLAVRDRGAPIASLTPSSAPATSRSPIAMPSTSIGPVARSTVPACASRIPRPPSVYFQTWSGGHGGPRAPPGDLLTAAVTVFRVRRAPEVGRRQRAVVAAESVRCSAWRAMDCSRRFSMCTPSGSCSSSRSD